MAFLYAIMRELALPRSCGVVQRLVAAFTALLFAFSLTFWSQTGIAEVYAPNAFMVALTTWLLVRWGQGPRHRVACLLLAALCLGLKPGHPYV